MTMHDIHVHKKMILKTEDLRIGYRRRRKSDLVVADGINLALYAGEMVCLLGSNGAGKSTLLRTLAALQPPLAGSVMLDGVNIHSLSAEARARQMSIVLTERPNAGLLSGYALVALGRHPYTGLSGRLSEADEKIVRWAVSAVGAENIAVQTVSEMSDGQRQKIMIARALAQEPDLILLDEPTAFLDLPHRVDVLHLLKGLARQSGQAILLSTHDLDLALRNADKLWLMADDQLFVGTPEDLVLSGAFEQAFDNNTTRFDIHSGAFRQEIVPRGSISVRGMEPYNLWTRRALEREGFYIDDRAPVRVDIVTDSVPTYWQLSMGDHASSCDSIEALLQELQLWGELHEQEG